MVKVLKENIKLYATWLVMIVLITVGVTTSKLLSVVALAIFGIFMLLSPTNDSYVLLFGLLPFANIFKYQAGSTSFFTICELLIVLFVALKSKKFKANFVITILLFASYMLLTSIGSLQILDIIKVLLGFFVIFQATHSSKKEDIINIAYLMSAGTILTMFLSMNSRYFTYIEPYLIDLNYVLDSSGHASGVLRISGFLGDPNYCSVLVIICIALLCVLYYYQKIKAEFWVFLVFLVTLGFFTYSKSYFLCIAILIAFLILFILFPKHRGWAIVSILAVTIVTSMALSGRIEVLNIIINRFSSGDITSGRAPLNELYLSHIWDNPSVLFFGEGISIEKFTGAINNVHNIYIESLFKLGIVGSLIYLGALFASANTKKRSITKRNIVNFFPLIFLAILYYALAGIMMYDYPFYIAIAFLAKDFNSLDEKTFNQELLVRRSEQ